MTTTKKTEFWGDEPTLPGITPPRKGPRQTVLTANEGGSMQTPYPQGMVYWGVRCLNAVYAVDATGRLVAPGNWLIK